jgi:hypothetical protein
MAGDDDRRPLGTMPFTLEAPVDPPVKPLELRPVRFRIELPEGTSRSFQPALPQKADSDFWDWVRSCLERGEGVDASVEMRELAVAPFELPEVGPPLPPVDNPQAVDELTRHLPLSYLNPDAPSIARPHGTRFSIRAWMPELREVYQRLRWRGEVDFCAPYLGDVPDAMAALSTSANTVVRLGLARYPRPETWEEDLDALVESVGGVDRAALKALLMGMPCDPGPAFIPHTLYRSEPLEVRGAMDLSALDDVAYLHDRLIRSMGIPREFLQFPEPGTPEAQSWMGLYERGLRMERELDFSPIAPLEPDDPEKPKG